MFCWRAVRHPSLCRLSQTLLARPLPLSSSQVSSLGFSFFITGSLLGVSAPIRLSQSCNYSSSSHHDSLPLHHHLPRLTVARSFICFARLSGRRPSFVSPAVYLLHPDVVLLFEGGVRIPSGLDRQLQAVRRPSPLFCVDVFFDAPIFRPRPHLRGSPTR